MHIQKMQRVAMQHLRRKRLLRKIAPYQTHKGARDAVYYSWYSPFRFWRRRPGQRGPISWHMANRPGRDGGYLHVSIDPCGENLCGTIQRAYGADGTLASDYEHLGKPILWNMGRDGDGRYSGGTIWAPDVDKTYRSKMQLKGNQLAVSGCVGPFCRSQDWQRVK